MTETLAIQLNQCIRSRQSIGVLSEPAPTAQQLERAFAAALTAPDHQRLRPWRFVVIDTAQRAAFGQILKTALAATGETEEEALARVEAQPFRAPMIIAAILHPAVHPKVPESEQWLSLGASVQNLLLQLHAEGLGAIWRSGPLIESQVVREAFQCTSEERLAGLIYCGTTSRMPPARVPLQPAEFVSKAVF